MARVWVAYPSLSRADVAARLGDACIRLEGKLAISRMILFGSYAQDCYTARSDIDVVVVYRGSERDDAYKVVMDQVGLARLEPRVYSEEQFCALMAGSPRFAEVLVREGIVIVGAMDRRWLKEAKTG